MAIDGAQLFMRYAYPPNSHGSCGPDDSDALLHYGQAGVTDAGLRELAKGFLGAWPYLELIGGTTHRDALDYHVVEAYWVGNGLLDRVGTTAMGNSMEDRFRARTGGKFPHLAEGVLAGGVPNHAFHVFQVYPWIGLLTDERRRKTALESLDRCRIRWGVIEAFVGDEVIVNSRPLVWDGRSLSFGEIRPESVKWAVGGLSVHSGLAVGDTVSMHWDWVCDKLTPAQLTQLQRVTAQHLRIANTGVEHRGVAIAMEA